MTHQAKSAANEALKLLAVLSRPTVKAAGRLQKRLVIEEGGHDREQVQACFPARGGLLCVSHCDHFFAHPSLAPSLPLSFVSGCIGVFAALVKAISAHP